MNSLRTYSLCKLMSSNKDKSPWPDLAIRSIFGSCLPCEVRGEGACAATGALPRFPLLAIFTIYTPQPPPAACAGRDESGWRHSSQSVQQAGLSALAPSSSQLGGLMQASYRGLWACRIRSETRCGALSVCGGGLRGGHGSCA